MKNSIFSVLLFAIISLIIGYLFFGKIGGEYVSLTTLLKPASNDLASFGQKISGITNVRNNIAICGGIGAILGIVIRVLKK